MLHICFLKYLSKVKISSIPNKIKDGLRFSFGIFYKCVNICKLIV